MRCIIGGTRTIHDYDLLCETIERSGFAHLITEVVCGELEEVCKDGIKLNVDILGWRWATERGIAVKHFGITRQMWAEGGKPEGPKRNRRMGLYAAEQQGRAILLWDGASPGTRSMAAIAEELGLNPYVRNLSEEQTEVGLWSAGL